jgi:hypothetical protein
MDTTPLHSTLALNGLDILLWIAFLVIAPKVLRFSLGTHQPRTRRRVMAQATPEAHLKIAV